MKIKTSEAESYFDKMNVGDTLIIFEKEVNSVNQQQWRDAFISLHPIEKINVKDADSSDSKKSNVNIVKCSLRKYSDNIGYAYLSKNNNPMDSLKQPCKIFKHQMTNFSSDREEFIEEFTFLILNRIIFDVNSEEAPLIYAIKQADILPSILDMYLDQEIYLSNGIYVKNIKTDNLSPQQNQILATKIRSMIGYGRTPVRDLIFGYFCRVGGQESFLDVLVPDYSQSFDLRNAKSIDDLDDFFIDFLEEKHGLPIKYLAQIKKADGVNDDRTEITGESEISSKELYDLFDKKMAESKNDEERQAIKKNFNTMLKAMNKNQSISREEAEGDWSDLDEYEGVEEKRKKGWALENANFMEQKAHYAVIAKRYSDAIIATFEDDSLSDAINNDYEKFQDLYQKASDEFENATSTEQKMGKNIKINNIISVFNQRLQTRLANRKKP